MDLLVQRTHHHDGEQQLAAMNASCRAILPTSGDPIIVTSSCADDSIRCDIAGLLDDPDPAAGFLQACLDVRNTMVVADCP